MNIFEADIKLKDGTIHKGIVAAIEHLVDRRLAEKGFGNLEGTVSEWRQAMCRLCRETPGATIVVDKYPPHLCASCGEPLNG